MGKIFHTGSEAHPASFSMGPGYYLSVQRPGRAADTKERVELYLYSRTVTSWPAIGQLCVMIGTAVRIPLSQYALVLQAAVLFSKITSTVRNGLLYNQMQEQLAICVRTRTHTTAHVIGIYVVASKCPRKRFISAKYKQCNHLNYSSFKIVPLRTYTLLSATVKVLETFLEAIL